MVTKQTPGQLAELDTPHLVEEIAAVRRQIERTQEALDEAINAGVPKVEYMERLQQWVEREARRFADNAEYRVSALRAPRPGSSGPTLLRAPVHGSSQMAFEGATSGPVFAEADVAGLLCWLFGDTLKQRLTELVEQSGYREGPPISDRPKLQRRLEEQADELGLQEERLIRTAEARGQRIHRREDCRPEIVLDLSLKDFAPDPEVTA